jgi:hypothetical protein
MHGYNIEFQLSDDSFIRFISLYIYILDHYERMNLSLIIFIIEKQV